MSCRHRPLRRARGFTLTELAVGLTLAGIAALVVFQIFFTTRDAYLGTSTVVENQAEARLALSLLVQDVRSAGADLRSAGIQRIAAAWGDTIRLQSDLDDDGVIDAVAEPPEDVTWYRDAGEERLMRVTGLGEMTIAEGVTFFAMNYYDENGLEIDTFPLSRADRARVRAVEFFLNVRVDEGAERSRSIVVSLRNDDPGV